MSLVQKFLREADPMSPRHATSSQSWFWLRAFLVVQIVCQMALLFELLGGLRIVMRTASFGVSLVFLCLLPGHGRPHPARRWAIGILVVVVLELANPYSTSALASIAQLSLYITILAPLFWVARLEVTPEILRRLLVVFWGFHLLSAAVGVLQVYYPGHFQPNISSVVLGKDGYVEGLYITLASGERVLRPMGLTDAPGGACTSGLYSVLFGVGFFLYAQSMPVRVISVSSMVMGLFDIYLSQVRSSLIMTAVCVIVFALVMLRRGETGRFVGMAVLVPLVVLSSFAWAVSVGGESVSNRLGTLLEDRPDQVYYRNRGVFLEWTFTELLPRAPLGVGLGRWGMANYYFGDRYAPENLYAEIQITGWLLDGGILLVVLYSMAVFVACRVAWYIALRASDSTLRLWAALILSYDIGALALTFAYPLFIGQGGLEFWFLNACLYGAAIHGRGSGQARKPSAGQETVQVA